MTPFVKWAGGKKQIINDIIKLIKDYQREEESADDNYTFFEPFVGGGVVFLTLQPERVVINDLNSELINAYKVVRDNPQKLMDELDLHKENYSKIPGYYYNIRAWDRPIENLENYNEVMRAARTIFLNKTCYNGLYRVNFRGEFNTPEGKYVNPTVYYKENIESVSEYLKNKKIKILNGDYKEAIKDAKQGDIIYLDPPYHYETDNGFTSYQKEGFTFEDFVTLKETCDKYINKGVTVIISNNDTTKIRELFENDILYTVYQLNKLKTNRTINSNAKKRRTGKEVIIVGINSILPQADNVEKLISLIKATDDGDLDNPDKVQSILGYTPRQSHYYLAALQFLGIINTNKKFTKVGSELRKLDGDKFNHMLAKQIVSSKYYSELYNLYREGKITLDNKVIAVKLKEMITTYNANTIKRRASTVRNWLE